MREILFASTTELAEAIRAQKVSAVEVLPYTVDSAGMPLGVQLVGKRWDESRLLAIAKAFTQVTGKFRRPPGYSRVGLNLLCLGGGEQKGLFCEQAGC